MDPGTGGPGGLLSTKMRGNLISAWGSFSKVLQLFFRLDSFDSTMPGAGPRRGVRAEPPKQQVNVSFDPIKKEGRMNEIHLSSSDCCLYLLLLVTSIKNS